jgi:DNA-binding winged helix-turn-helix (wHTH) protein
MAVRYLFENYTFDPDRRELRRGAEMVPIAPQVFDLVDYLIRNRERVVSKGHLEWPRRLGCGVDDPP